MFNSQLGEINFSSFLILSCASIAGITDLYSKKIYNWLTLSVMLLGLILQGYENGFTGLAQSVLGIGTGILILGWLFVFRVMGAGDVKLLMAFGAVGGARYCLNVAALSLFLGVVLSLIVMTKERKLLITGKRIYFFFLTLFHRELRLEFLKPDASLYVPYGVAIGGAAVWLMYENPLTKWGVLPWN